jgi:hypothetical protein
MRSSGTGGYWGLASSPPGKGRTWAQGTVVFGGCRSYREPMASDPPHVTPHTVQSNPDYPGALLVIVQCPHCGKDHGHGIPPEEADSANWGHRVADCGRLAGYVLDAPA